MWLFEIGIFYLNILQYISDISKTLTWSNHKINASLQTNKVVNVIFESLYIQRSIPLGLWKARLSWNNMNTWHCLWIRTLRVTSYTLIWERVTVYRYGNVDGLSCLINGLLQMLESTRERFLQDLAMYGSNNLNILLELYLSTCTTIYSQDWRDVLLRRGTKPKSVHFKQSVCSELYLKVISLNIFISPGSFWMSFTPIKNKKPGRYLQQLNNCDTIEDDILFFVICNAYI